MAKIVGEAGRYVSHQATRLRNRIWITGAVGIGGLGCIAGFAAAWCFPHPAIAIWVGLLIAVLGVVAMLLFSKWCFRHLDELEQDGEHWRKGVSGEVAVGLKLEEFPDEFRVVNDLRTRCGNLDHVVIGPTGVFVIDTKDWRGVVAADGKGELTLNDQPLDQPYVSHFLARVMEVKEKVRVLASDYDPYFQALFVFTSARVEASYGTTGPLHCVSSERLFDYIVNQRFGRKLPAIEVGMVAEAFVALAQMETAFFKQTARAGSGKTRTSKVLGARKEQAKNRQLAQATVSN